MNSNDSFLYVLFHIWRTWYFFDLVETTERYFLEEN
jgi:hypothetical protein